jgi:hypothetical protein
VHGDSLAGPGIIFFQVLTFVLVVGAIAMIVHALTRKAERWNHPWTRFIWVLLGAAWAISLVFALIWPNDTTYTIVGIAFVVILVTEVAYLLRVVFPGRGARAIAPEPAPAPPAPDSAEPVSVEPLEFDATDIPDSTTEEQSPDA